MNKKNTSDLGIIINKAREKKGLSQRGLAKIVNMDFAEISRIESGKRKKPNYLYLKGIAETLDLSLVELMKLAGYTDFEINFANDNNKRSTQDYINALKDYEDFYYAVLEDIENRRRNDMKCKKNIHNLIYKLENFKTYQQDITNEKLVIQLKEILDILSPNLKKLDKAKYPKYDKLLFDKK